MSVVLADRHRRDCAARAEALQTLDRPLDEPEHSRAHATVLAASARTEAPH